MSFSYRTKNELSRVSTKRRCCMLAELAGIIHISGVVEISGRGRYSLKISTENASLARRIFVLFKDIYKINVEILVRKNTRLRKKNSYFLIVPTSNHTKQILTDTCSIYRDNNGQIVVNEDIDKNLIAKRCCKKAYLRGAFLGGGSMSDPEKMYHLEFVTHRQGYAKSLCELLNYFEIHAKIIERKNNYVVYLKEGEHIVNLLNIMGAHSSLLEFENIRAYKDMRNNINRIVNCETANLTKTINASMRQIDNIEYIKKTLGYDKLPQSLKEIAELRLNYPDASLKELGQMLDPPIGKSGVNHRLRKLDKLADDLRQGKIEGGL